MSTFIWKPSTINSWKRGVAFLAPDSTDSSQAPTINANGKTYTGKYINTNEGRHQWVFPSELAGMQDLEVSYGGTTGKISNGSMSYEGAGIDSWAERAKGSLGGPGGGMGMFTPGMAGAYGVYPAFLGGMFPTAAFGTYNPISKARYKFTDPMKYAKEFGEANAETYRSNQKLGKEFALDQIDTELQALKGYAPAAAALKMGLTSADNQFNQAQRTKQVDTALPGVRKQLEGQASRAEAYANGRLPDSMQDRALELGVRSQAADNAMAGGFGASSSVARKASDLMSAERRIQLGMQGEQLLSSNIANKSNLLMAPTEYSDAGTQVRVMPAVDAGTLQGQQATALNAATMMDPATALQAEIQQNQYSTNLAQRTKEFNAGNMLQNSQFNASAANQFALGQFDYLTGYATSVADATQKDINTTVALDQQEKARRATEETMRDAQTGNTINAVTGAVGTGAGIVKDIINSGGGSVDSVLPEVPDLTVPDFDTGYTETPNPVMESPVSDVPMVSPDSMINGVPDFSATPEITLYSNTAGISPDTARSLIGAENVKAMTNSVARNFGVSNTPQAGYTQTGYDSLGKPVYMDASLKADPTPYKALENLSNFNRVLQPLQTDIDPNALQTVAERVMDPELVADLNAKYAARDSKGFVNTLQEAFGKPAAHNAKGEALDTAFSGAKVYEHWGDMSDAQKALAIASVGTQGLRGKNGKPVGELEVPISKMDGAPALRVKDALKVAALGYNPTEVSLNWGDITNVQRMLGVSGTLKQRLNTAESLGLITRV